MDENKKTYGQATQEHWAKLPQVEDDVIEYRRKMEKEVLAAIENTVKQSKLHPLYLGKNFYVVLLMNIERFGHAARTRVFARRSCPTPTYKQSVWKYNLFYDRLEFLWSIPDSILYYHIIKESPKYLKDKECSDLAKFVILMESGEMLKWVKKENGEKPDAVIKIKEPEVCHTTK